MKSIKFQKNAHNINIREVSKKIFDLEDEELGIINTVAKNGPMILTGISDITKKLSNWHCTQWAAGRRISGTRRTLGLKRHEYLIKKEHEKRIRGKKGGIYYLSTKGMFAALSTGLRLDEIYIYKKFIDFIKTEMIKENQKHQIKNFDLKMISKMYKEYIKNRIQLFLIWHESEGRNVTRINSFQQYLQEFYSQIDKDFYSKFNGNNKKNNQYIETLQKGLILDKIIQAFDAIANPRIGFGQDANTSKFFLHNISTVGKYVWYWPYYMEMIQFRDRKQNEPINYIENPQKTLDIGNHITIDGKHITYYDVVKNKLEEIGINKSHAENVLSYIWDKQHKQLESLNVIKF